MNKIKVLSIVSIVLLLTNLILVAFIILRPATTRKHDGPRDIIIEKLHFNETQVNDYDKLIKSHRSAIKESQDKIMTLKNLLYSTLVTETQTTLKDSIIGEINQVQMTIENIHYSHFMDIKGLCKNEQLTDFENLTLEIASLFPSQGPKGRK